MNRKLVYYTVALLALLTIGLMFYYANKKHVTNRALHESGKATMFQLPPLPYDYNALEPYIDARTLEIHYTKHHQGYVNKLNKAIESHPDIASHSIEDVLKDLNAIPAEIREAVRNFGGGVYNHTFFWHSMKKGGGGKAVGAVAYAIDKEFGSFDQFKDLFSQTAKKLFGSGWAWLSVDSSGKLLVHETLNQDCPLSMGYTPLLCLDVWEHAYYLKYQNKRDDFVDAWWNLVDWDMVERRYSAK